MAAEAPPPLPDGFEEAEAPPPLPAGFKEAAPQPGLFARGAKAAGEFLDAPVPILDPIQKRLQDAAAGSQAAAGDLTSGVAESATKAGLPEGVARAAGVAAGLPGAAISAAQELGAGFVPAKVKDVALLLGTEGASAVGGTAGRVGVGAAMGYGLKGAKGAAGGALLGAVVPPAVAKFFTETPMTETTQRAMAAAAELNIPRYLDEVSDSPAARWIGDKLRSDPSTAKAMATADAARAQQLVAAKTDLLDALGPGGSPEGLGARVQAEAGPKIAGQDATRLGAYGAAREAATSGFPAPDLLEARGAALTKAAAAQQGAAKAVRGTLYDFANTFLPDAPSNIRVPDAEAYNQAQEIAAQVGQTKAGRSSSAYKIAQDIIGGDADQQAARGAVKDLLDAAEEKSKAGMGSISDLAQQAITRDPSQLRILPPDLQAAYVNRGLGAARASLGDAGALEARPDLLAQLPPDVQQALKTHGTMSLDLLNEHLRNIADAVAEEKYSKSGPADVNNVGRQLGKISDALKSMRADYFASNAPEAADAFRFADVFHADYADTFRDKNVLALYNSDPVGVLKRVVVSNDVDALKTLTKAVGSAGAPVLKRQLFDLAFGDGTKIPSEEELTTNLAKIGPAVRTVFSPFEQAGLRAFAKTGDLPQFLQSAYEAKLRGFMEKDSDKIVNTLLDGKGDVLLARAIKRYTTPETYGRLGRMIANGILTPVGDMPEQRAAGILRRVGGYSDQFLQQFFDPATVRRMKTIGEAAPLLPGFGDLSKVQAPSDSAAMFTRGGLNLSPKIGMVKGAVGDAVMWRVGKDELMKMYTDPQGAITLRTLLRLPEYDPRWGTLLKRVAQTYGLQYRAYRNAQDNAQANSQGGPGANSATMPPASFAP